MPDYRGPGGEPWDPAPGCWSVGTPVYRWGLGSFEPIPFYSEDIEINPRTAGLCAEAIDFGWYWLGDGNEGLLNLAIGIATSESWSCDPLDDGTTSAYPGIIYQFGLRELNLFDFANINLVGTGLCHQLPSDGRGGLLVYLYTYVDNDGDGLADDIDGDGAPDFTAPQPPAGGQMLLWGAGNHEPISDGRCGTHQAEHINGIPPACRLLEFEGVCPNPLGVSIGLWCRVPCACAGDLNNDQFVDLADLALLLSMIGGPPAAPCADSDDSEVIDLPDLTNLLAEFGQVCGC